MDVPLSSIALARQLIKLGLPIVISTTAVLGLGVTDTLMAGLASTRDLAALGVGANLYFIVVMMLIGLQSVVAPRVSWRLASGKMDRVRHEVWQSLWIGVTVGFVMMVLLYYLTPLLHFLKLEPAVERVARRYISIVALTLPLIGFNQVLRATFDGFGYTTIAMSINLAAFLLNIVLNYVLVFGMFGLPAMGALGCAIATLCVVLMQTALAIFIAQRHTKLRQLALFSGLIKPQWVTVKTLLLLGLPAAISITLEEGFFAASGLLVAPMGTVPLAAHQVVINIAICSLVVPIGLGQAGAIVVGSSLGAGQLVTARRQAMLLIRIILVVGFCVAAVMFTFRSSIVGLFTRDATIVAIAVPLVLIACVQLLVDGVQLGSNITLKGYQDTVVPAMLQGFSYWCVGFPLAWILSHTGTLAGPYGVTGVWVAIATGLFVSSVLGFLRLRWISIEFATARRSLKQNSAG